MFNEHEVFFECPHCGERISFLLEELFGSQTYIEDCEVCCRPIKIAYSINDGELEQLVVEPSQ